MERGELKNRNINYVSVIITTESSCNPKEGEYNLYLEGFIGSLDLSSCGGVDDISLIKTAIKNDLDFDKLPNDGCVEVILRESGEWEDVFWHKYYVIDRFVEL